MNWINRWIFAALLGSLCWCNHVAAAEPLKIMVMIQPQRYFVEQIGGNRVAVTVLVPPGGDPHTYEPKPQTMLQASQASLYIAMGIPEEQVWLPRLLAIRPNLPVIHQDEGIPKMPMESREEIHGSHCLPPGQEQQEEPALAPGTAGKAQGRPDAGGHGHHHDSEVLDPHIWLSPKLARMQAETIARALCKLDPGSAADYQERLRSFLQRIDALDQRLTRLFEPIQKRRGFLVVHPSWGYFASDYGLQQIPLEIEGKEPTAGDLVKLIQLTTREGITVILLEPQFSQRFADVMAHQTGVQVMEADPLALDWEHNLWEVAGQLAERLSAKP